MTGGGNSYQPNLRRNHNTYEKLIIYKNKFGGFPNGLTRHPNKTRDSCVKCHLRNICPMEFDRWNECGKQREKQFVRRREGRVIFAYTCVLFRKRHFAYLSVRLTCIHYVPVTLFIHNRALCKFSLTPFKTDDTQDG